MALSNSLEKDKLELFLEIGIKMLLPEDIGETNQGVSVVAVIGFGGLGKTTLAKYVYNDDRVVKGGFELRLWVCVNYLSNLEQVLIEIIGSIGEKPSNLSLEGLKDRLIGIIGGKKFLVVLDDVWDEDDSNWHRLKPLLDYGKGGSQVLVTTRSNTVARCLGTSKQYQLGVLSKEYAWSLFVEMTFDEGELGRHPELEPLGRQVVDRCGRVPLAVAVVGRVLRHRDKDESTWSQFLDNELAEVLSNDAENKIMQVLMVSYNDLPLPLKHCFASCSLFPKDYEFDKDELIRLWIGQGLIRPSNNKWSMEEVGEKYFFHLVDRCFFQEVQEKFSSYNHFSTDFFIIPDGHTAKVHDLLHDLAINVVGTESKYLNGSDDSMNRDGLRHISFNSSLDWSFDRIAKAVDPKMVRTILLRKYYVNGIGSFTRFKMLRMLEISSSGIDNIPDSIGELVYLRYLNLSGNRYMKHLPSSICKLHQLMILVLEGCGSLMSLPSNIGKLVSLRQLLLDGCSKLDSFPSGLAELTSLVNLDPVIVHHHDGGLRYLNSLNNLRGILKIKFSRQGWSNAVEDAEKSNMSRKNKLRGMFIDLSELALEPLVKEEANAVLVALEPHKYLEYLNIRSFTGDKLSRWVRTHHIKELYLFKCDVEYIEDETNCNIVSFPSLKVLELKNLRNLKGWWKHVAIENDDQTSRRHCLSNVVRVVIEDCEELTGRMPLFGENIGTLVLSGVQEKVVRELLLLPEGHGNYFFPYPMLKQLSVTYIINWLLAGLAHIPYGPYPLPDGSPVSIHGLAHLTNLEILDLKNSWWRLYGVGDEESEVGMPWKALQRLRVLTCEVTSKHVEEGFQYLTSLEKLNIQFSPVDYGRVELPLIALQKLRSLSISCHSRGRLPSLSLPNGIQDLPYLEKLKICDCKELFMSWKAVLFTKKLFFLSIENVRKLVNVEEVAEEEHQSQSHLRELEIDICEVELEHDIPWKLLGSLQRLDLFSLCSTIHRCPSLPGICSVQRLEQLPDGIQHLTSLNKLSIRQCSKELEHRCQRGRGEDWHLISHVRWIEIWSR